MRSVAANVILHGTRPWHPIGGFAQSLTRFSPDRLKLASKPAIAISERFNPYQSIQCSVPAELTQESGMARPRRRVLRPPQKHSDQRHRGHAKRVTRL